MSQFISEPDLILYLKANTDNLISRIKNRNRDFEKDVSPEYIHSLNVYYKRWISKLNQDKVLVIETDHFNIFKDKDKMNDIVESIKRKLSR